MIKALLLLFALVGSAQATVTGHIAPSRTTGVAPLAVFFDATGSTTSIVGAEISAWSHHTYSWMPERTRLSLS